MTTSKRPVLAIPLEEIQQHLRENPARQDVKVVVPELLSQKLYAQLAGRGKPIKPEEPLRGDRWHHSRSDEPNQLCESSDFAAASSAEASGPFAISFANEHAGQDKHYHKQHLELYYSEHRIAALYQDASMSEPDTLVLEHGGAIIFGPGVSHWMQLGGFTVIIEMPAVRDDKYTDA